MWRIWLAHNLIEQFWKILKSVLAISPVKVKLIKAESRAQASLMDNENLKVACTIV